jgi:hypothetical protein
MFFNISRFVDFCRTHHVITQFTFSCFPVIQYCNVHI